MALGSGGRSESLTLELRGRDAGLGAALTRAEGRLLAFQKGLTTVNAKIMRLAQVGALAGAAIAAAFIGIGKSFIGVAQTFENLKTQLNVLYKSVDKGAAAFEKLNKFAELTPFSLQEVVATAVRLKSFGMDWERMLKNVGDLAAGMQVPLEEVADAFGRIRSGMVGAGLMGFARMGISRDALRDLGIQFTQAGELVDKSREGITKLIDTLQDLIKTRFGGMMETMSATMTGRISNLGDVWDRVRVMIIEPTFDAVKVDLQKILNTIEEWTKSGKLEEWTKKIGKVFLDAYRFVTDTLGPAVIRIFTKVVESDAFKVFKRLFIAAARNLDTILIVAAMMKALEIALQLRTVLLGIGFASLISKGSLMVGSAVVGMGGTGAAALATASLLPVVGGVVATLAALGGFYYLVSILGDPGRDLRQWDAGAILRKPKGGVQALPAHGMGFQSNDQLRAEMMKIAAAQNTVGAGGGPGVKAKPDLGWLAGALDASGYVGRYPDEHRKKPRMDGQIFNDTRMAEPDYVPLDAAFGYTMDDLLSRQDLELESRRNFIDMQIQLEERKKDTIIALAQSQHKLEMGLAQGAMNTLMRMTSLYTEFRGASLKELGRIAKIAILEEVSTYLSAKARQWAIDAMGAVAHGLMGHPGAFAAAAKYAAAATAAGAGAAVVANLASAERDKVTESISGKGFGTEAGGADYRGTDTGGQRIGGTIRADNLSITIAPSVSIMGETVIIGTMGVEELKDTLGQATVEAVQDAVDTGTLDLSRIR